MAGVFMGVDQWLKQQLLILSMYRDVRSRARVGYGYKVEFGVEVGVHLGSVLSLILSIIIEASSGEFPICAP